MDRIIIITSEEDKTRAEEGRMMVSSSSTLPNPIINGARFYSNHHHHHQPATTIFKWGLRREQDARLVTRRAEPRAFRVLANPNVSRGGDSIKEVIMVDPLEAKRLAAKQMGEIKAKEKFKRKRQIEAINGAWAMIGLTAGLVIEGHTGKSLLSQLAGYWETIFSFFAL